MSEVDDDTARHAEHLAIRKRAMDMLARREHAYAELVTKLAKREHDRDDIDIVLDTLVVDGLLSDSRFAEASAANKASRGIGPVRIRAELAQLGVAEAVVDTALTQVDTDWFEQARATRAKRFGPDLPTDFSTKAKQMRFLQRRGFDGDTLAAVFDDR